MLSIKVVKRGVDPVKMTNLRKRILAIQTTKDVYAVRESLIDLFGMHHQLVDKINRLITDLASGIDPSSIKNDLLAIPQLQIPDNDH